MTLLNKYIAIIVCTCLLSCSVAKKKAEGLPFYNQPDLSPEWIAADDPGYKTIHTIPAFSFTDQDGNTVTEKTMEGKIYVADFFFTHCGSICPVLTKNMGTLQAFFKANDQVGFLSHTVLPEMDSVPVLKKYASDHGVISGKWHLLTGDREIIYSLARKQYFAGDTVGYYKTGDEFLHTENFLLIDQHRRIRGVYNGTVEFEMERLKEDIGDLLKED